jgi:hypothetical protein
MAVNNFERLTAQDLQFLVMESPTMPMDMVSTQIYARGPLMQADGGVDIDSYRENIESILHRIPRARQKLKWIPYADIPVWVDAPNFNTWCNRPLPNAPRGWPMSCSKLSVVPFRLP